MVGISDTLLLEAMFQNWRHEVVQHEAQADGFDSWLRRIFVNRLQFLAEGALA
jgi:hypothetical protein